MQKPSSKLTSLTLALTAGALTVFAFAPFGFWPLQILSLALLFSLVRRAETMRTAFVLGWAFGSASIASGTYWLYISMHDYGGLPPLLAALAVLLLAACLGIFYALALHFASTPKRPDDYKNANQ